MAKFVEAKIIQRKILLFSKKYTPACRQVKEILNSYNLSPNIYEVVEIERRQDVNEIETHFQVICLTDRREVPQLFINQKYIGGQKEILLLHRTGELEKLLNEVQLEEDNMIRRMAEDEMEVNIEDGEVKEKEEEEEEGEGEEEEEEENEEEEKEEEEKEQEQEDNKCE